MQEFLKNNTVNCNLMSLTGYRTLVLLKALMESPKSIDELNECFLQNQYIKEKFSPDTLRIYVNSLRAIGCDITKANKSTNNKYVLKSHPFSLEISKTQLIALSKIYKNMYDKIELRDVIVFEKLLHKISEIAGMSYENNPIIRMSVLKNIDKKIVSDLILNVRKKNQINFLYNTPNSGMKNISIIADKLSFRADKLYLWGFSSLYNEYSYFRVDRIKKILSVNIRSENKNVNRYKVQFELKLNSEYTPLEDERIISKAGNKYIIEKSSKNKFSLIQDLLYYGSNCMVVSPADIRVEIKDLLRNMEGLYNG